MKPVKGLAPDGRRTVTAPSGARVLDVLAEHTKLLAPKLHEVAPGTWSLQGNGLSNQSFIEAPEGIIAIDSGESVEEMRAALLELRRVTSRPIVAVIYTHFHYVEGTTAIIEEPSTPRDLPIYGHPRICVNRQRISSEIAPAYARGVVEQFGIFLPQEGPDALENNGIGIWFSNPAHAPFTPGHLPITHELRDGEELRIAGLRVVVNYAPSDADDSVTLWFPERGLCVNNLIWPTLFNVFAIRGEEYRDCRILIEGIDRLRALAPDYLVATHGPPLTGKEKIAEVTERYRDSLQFLWDQTVRGINKGHTADELADQVRLPDLFDVDYLTSEHYGVGEHHVRQIHAGLRGFFDGDESKLLPLEPTERFERLIAGFGGREVVAQEVERALKGDDVRWALELATWLSRSREATINDRVLLARCLRVVAERTPAANIRNWALTRARHLDGSMPMDFLMRHRLNARQLADVPLDQITTILKVLVDPDAAQGLDCVIALEVDGERSGWHLRRCVAVPESGSTAEAVLHLDRSSLEKVLGGAVALSELVANGTAVWSGDGELGMRAIRAFEVEGLRA